MILVLLRFTKHRTRDIIIINGLITDFDHNSFVQTSIAIKNGKILKIGQCDGEAIHTLDARNRVVSPGFIDSHMHEEIIGHGEDDDDFDIAYKALSMGVTTSVGGQCGFSWGGIQQSKRFIDFINHNGSPVNYLLYAGYNSLRQKVGSQQPPAKQVA